MRIHRHTQILFAILLFSSIQLYGQGQKKIIQITGLVVTNDTSAFGLIGTYVYVKKSGRGAITNEYGYFSFAALAGDEIIVSHLGYKRQTMIIPDDTSGAISYLVEMTRDTTVLPVVEVTYFPTEEAFKKAILTTSLPKEYSNLDNNLNDQIMERLLADSDMGASLNYKYYMSQQINANQQKYLAPYNPLLDPFAWGRFIRDISGRKKKKKKKR